jgi:hypothetical protein
VKGNVHAKGMENFRSHLKRTICGAYIFVMPFHLFRYLHERRFLSTTGIWRMRRGSNCRCDLLPDGD